MKKWLLLNCLVVMFGCKLSLQVNPKSEIFYVGTYTNGKSEGIYKMEIQPEGTLVNLGLVAKTSNPSFLAITKDKNNLIAVNENEIGAVSLFSMQNDSLQLINIASSGGKHPCFVDVNVNNQVLVANYSSGTVSYLKIENQQLILKDESQHQGKTSHTRQDAPHAHSANFHPNSDEILAADLGTNHVWMYTISQKDSLQFTKQKQLQMPDAAGPRHMAFHPKKTNVFYVLNELSNTVSLVSKVDDTYQIQQNISTLPADFKAYNTAADIHITNDGKFLYTSNRGHDSIAIFKIEANNQLTLVGFEATKGKTPRNFKLSPNNRFLLVANQNSNSINSFQRNTTTGLLTFVSQIEVPSPTCIVF